VADRPLQAVAQDLQAAGRKPFRQRIQGVLDISGGEFPEFDIAQGYPQRLDRIPV
jgi:hypothetical protein